MDSLHGSSFGDRSSQNNPNPLPVSGRNLDQSSVAYLKLVENEWHEMKTIDDDGKVEFHYGKPGLKWGVSSSKPLTHQDLLDLDDTEMLSFDIFVLLQHSIFANSRYCNSWFMLETDLKWHEIEDRNVVRVKNSDSWFETVMDDERGKCYYYAKAGELIGNWYLKPKSIEELELLDDANMLMFDMFCRMQVVILTQLEPKGNFSNKKTNLSMLKDILYCIYQFSELKQTRILSEENYLQTAARLENIRIGEALTEFTSGMKNGTIDPEEVALHKERIISDLVYAISITGRNARIDYLLDEFKSELEKHQRQEIVEPEEKDEEVEEIKEEKVGKRQQSRCHCSLKRLLASLIHKCPCIPRNKNEI